MSSRDTILAALEQTEVPFKSMPEIAISCHRDDLFAYFTEMLEKAAGLLVEVTNDSEIQAYLDEQIKQNKRVVSVSPTVNGNSDLGAEPHQLQDIDLAVVEGEFAVAENGAVFVRTSATGHRALSFIAENLAVVVNRDAIVANMHQAIAKVNLNAGESGSFIAGPSKTADIEQSLVIGAHGACSVTVFMRG